MILRMREKIYAFEKYNIDINSIADYDDLKFVERCTTAEDFREYIGEVDAANYKVIVDRKERIGIFSFRIEECYGVKTGIPILYIWKKKSISSVMAMVAVVNYLFESVKIDRVSMVIFENNREMNRIVQRVGFKLEGYLPYCEKRENGFIGLKYYAMLKKEFQELCTYYEGM